MVKESNEAWRDSGRKILKGFISEQYEREREKGMRKQSPSKEHRPDLIAETGMFMNGDGIPPKVQKISDLLDKSEIDKGLLFQ